MIIGIILLVLLSIYQVQETKSTEQTTKFALEGTNASYNKDPLRPYREFSNWSGIPYGVILFTGCLFCVIIYIDVPIILIFYHKEIKEHWQKSDKNDAERTCRNKGDK